MGIPVLIDEAYAEFVERQEDTCIKTGLLYDNVMTSRTFSKAKGAAGVRIGAAAVVCAAAARALRDHAGDD